MIKLYLDEDVPEAIAVALRLRGYDVMMSSESGRKVLLINGYILMEVI